MKNFEFEHNGKKYWYSRSVVCVSMVYGTNAEGKTCVLLGKRGNGMPNEAGKWNLIAGFLDFNETLYGCCVREVYEETGVKLYEKDFHMHSILATKDGDQNVSFRMIAHVPTDIITNTKLGQHGGEKNEVAAVKWVPVDEFDNYEWAFNHRTLVDRLLKSEKV